MVSDLRLLARFAAFLLFALAILGAVHAYLWLRLVRQPQLAPPWRHLGAVLLVVLALLVPLSMLAPRLLSRPWAAIAAWPGHVWLGLMLLLFSFLLGTELLRLAIALLARPFTSGQGLDTSQRLLVARLLAGAAGAATVLVGAWAMYQGSRAPRVRELRLVVPELPASLAGLTIVQLTDLHIGATKSRASTEDIVRRTNALAPDLVAITGDLVEGRFGTIHGDMAPLAELRARWGVFMVTGNHEYYSGVREWLPELERLGIKVLRNERVTLGDGEGKLDLAGIDDWSAAGMEPGHGPDLERALAGRAPGRPTILLSHQPKAAIPAARFQPSLVLSGHTHGGQIWPFNYLVRLQQPFIEGEHRVDGIPLYVSPGTGYWGPPLRLGTRAEITKIVLLAGTASARPDARPR